MRGCWKKRGWREVGPISVAAIPGASYECTGDPRRVGRVAVYAATDLMASLCAFPEDTPFVTPYGTLTVGELAMMVRARFRPAAVKRRPWRTWARGVWTAVRAVPR